jgi:transposase
MGYKRGVDRSQAVMFPEALDDYITEDNAVRFLDAFVDALDMVRLDFKRAIPGNEGAPAYDPRTLLKLFIYGYLNEVRSSRRLERETKRNVEVMWLLGRLSPDHKTISDFRKEHPDQIKGVTKEFIAFCKELKLLGKKVVGIDGSKFAAVNGNQSNYTQKRLKQEMEAVEEGISAYMSLLEESDAEEGGTRRPTTEELKAKIALLEASKAHFAALQKQMEDLGETQVSTTDPESRLMSVQGRFDVSYNVQIAVDAENHLIVAHDVTNAGNDQEQLAAMAIAAKEELGVETLTVVADGGYFSDEQFAQCEAAGIEAHLPHPREKTDGVYPKSQFTYLPTEDAYRCPGEALLTYRHTERRKGKEQRCYQTTACGTCPLRAKCTTAKGGRRIRRSVTEWAAERVNARVAENPEILRQRKELVEHPYGTMKRARGDGYFLTRGLRKVRGEFSFSVLAYNLRRVFKLVPLAELLAALRRWRGSRKPLLSSVAPSVGGYGGLCAA